MITSSQVDIVYLDPKDNICVAARHLNAGEIIHVDGGAHAIGGSMLPD